MKNSTTTTSTIQGMNIAYTLVTCNIGWTGGKRHIGQIMTTDDKDSRVRPLCADAFRWDGTRQATYVKNEAPTSENVNCKKCLARL